MKSYKLTRNLWLVSSIGFLISFIIDISISSSFLLLFLKVVTIILCFVNVYINHTKLNDECKKTNNIDN